MPKSLCKRKRVKPNKCKKLRGCKVARGTKRTFCRKARNKTNKKRGTYKRKRIRGGYPRKEDEIKVKFIDENFNEYINERLVEQDKIDLYNNLLEIYSAMAGDTHIDNRLRELINKTNNKIKSQYSLETFETREIMAKAVYYHNLSVIYHIPS